jgi:hypothetical protein
MMYRYPDPGVKKAPDPESGSATLQGVPIFCCVLLPEVMNVADQGDKKKSSQQLLMRYPPKAE